ncbi:hypothetical protein [Henriciella litoralis]|uniref:hypothetical protein n=1 Tax=Henriciella litoralis TaxID=568102 RepID=UPI000A07BB31|nr:hypothetical protein [Henriciella litoralis]
MSGRGHRSFPERIVLAVFGLPIFRERWIRWPLAVLIGGLAIQLIYAETGGEQGAGRFVLPTLLFLFALFLVLFPLLPIADDGEDKKDSL